MIKINQIKFNIDNFSEEKIKDKCLKILKLKENDIDTIKILRKNIDLRDKNNINFVFNIALKLNIDEYKFLLKNKDKNILKYEEILFSPKKLDENILKKIPENYRPLIIGFGPSGIFCAYILALVGLKPIVLERGKAIDEREKDIEIFLNNNILNENSNVSFGEGGAGTFSDGKLYTRNNSGDGLNDFILKTFIKYGADESILYESNAHIGTDKLKGIIKNIRNEIINLGGEIKFKTLWTYDSEINKKYLGPKILAIGNSARDTMRDLFNNKFDLKPKAFAIGYRVAHRQSLINKGIFGKENLKDNANYKLLHKINDRSIYSFCMCPGGFIINSSNFKNELSINGMSYNDRKNIFANSAIIININEKDFYKESPLDGIKLVENIEKKAYNIGNGFIPYAYFSDLLKFKKYELNENSKDINDVNDIDVEKAFKGKIIKSDKLFDIYENLFDFDFNKYIIESILYFEKIIKGFSKKDTIIAGVETRTSSPVKLDRNENYECNIKDFYPIGEGLGHGGGIMSCAMDGIRVANEIIERIKNIYG